MRPKVASSRRKAQTRSRGGASRESARRRVICCSRIASRPVSELRDEFLQARGDVARRGADEIAGIDQPVADLGERKADEATRAERRQHDLRAFLGARSVSVTA